MEDGLQLLYEIIEHKLKFMDYVDDSLFIINGINLVEIYSSIEDDPINFSLVDDLIIKSVLKYNNKDDKIDEYKRIRDLYLGIKTYGINIKNINKYENEVNEFIDMFKKFLISIDGNSFDIMINKDKCLKLRNALKNNELIEDIDYIKELVNDYNKIRYTKNMLEIITYITYHNIKLLNTTVNFDNTIDISLIKEVKLDQRINNMLKYLKINYMYLPINIINELKKCNVDEVIETFNLIKQKRAEKYGILHLIKKDNYLSKLYLVLYSNKKSIIETIDALKDNDNYLDMNVLKKLINNALPVFFTKENAYFISKHDEYINNIKLLKELNVDYKNIIIKCPMFILTNNRTLNNTLDILSKYGADKKKIINLCYKSLMLNPNVLIDNLYILIKNRFDIKKYFDGMLDEYNLLKTINLNDKLNYVINTFDIKCHETDSNIIYNLILNKINSECYSSISWSV